MKGSGKNKHSSNTKNSGGCRCGVKSGGYKCGPNCNKTGGNLTCGRGASCVPYPFPVPTGGGRNMSMRRRRTKSRKKNRTPGTKTKKGRRKRRTRKGGVWPFDSMFGSNNNTQNSQNQYPQNNVVLPPMTFAADPQNNVAPPPAVGRPYGSYSPIARRNNRLARAKPSPRRQQFTQTHQYQLNRMNHGANQFTPRNNVLTRVGNTEAEVRERINKILGTLDTYMGRIFERQIKVKCNERGHTLYMNTLYVFTHHIIQILLTPTVSSLAQALIASSSNFIGNLLLMIHKFFSEQVASTGEINESFLLMVSWFIRTMGSGIRLAIDLSNGPILFSNFVKAILTFLQETTVNMTTTTIIPLGVFIYLVYNTFIYSYMKVLDRTDKLVKYMGPILTTLGITIDNFEKMTTDDIKDKIRNNVWDYIITNSPVAVVLKRDVLDDHIARICQAAINHDYILWMLQTGFGEPVSRQSQAPMAAPQAPMAAPQAPMAAPQAPMAPHSPLMPPMASMPPPQQLPAVGYMPPPQHTPYPTHPENNNMNNDGNNSTNYEYLDGKTVNQLKSILKKKYLDTNGKKVELINRLLENGWTIHS
jgi:hypothetical protein